MANILTSGQEVSRFCALGHPLKPYTFSGPWMRSGEAAMYVGTKHRCGCPSVKAFWNWRVRYGVISQRNLVAKADLDRVIRSLHHHGKRQRLAS